MSRRFLFLLVVISLASVLLRGALPENVLADLRTRAGAGDRIAQYNLGIAYADPSESFFDLSEAYAWLTLAAERGSNKGALTALMAKLSSAQLDEGNRRLEARRAQLAKVAEQSPFLSPITPVRADPPATPANAPAPEISRLQDDKKQLSADLSAARRDAEAAKTASIAKVAELNQQLAERDRTIAALKAQAASAVVATSSTGAAELAAKDAALKQAESARESLSRDLAALSNENASLKNQLASEQRAQSQLSAKALESRQQGADLTAARSQLASLRADLDQAQTAATKASAEIVTLKLEKERTDSRIRELTSGAERDQSALKAELENTRRQLALGEESVARLNAETKRLNDELAAAKGAAVSASELSALRVELDAARSARVNAERERDELKNAPPPAQAIDPAEHERLKKQLTDADSKLNVALRSFSLQQQENDEVRKNLAAVTDERSQLGAKLEAVTQEKETLAREISASAPVLADVAALREQVRHAHDQNAVLVAELNQLKTRVAIATPSAAGSAYSSPTRPGTAAAASAAVPPPATRTPQPAAPAETSVSKPVPSSTVPPAATATAGPRIHVVKLGDSLFKISQQYYGQANRWDEIAAANRDVLPNPNQLVVGTRLRIP